MLTIIDDELPVGDIGKFDLVIFGSNIYGEILTNFERELYREYPYIQEANIKQPYGDLRRLGTRLTIKKEHNPIFSILYVNAKQGKKKYGFYIESFVRTLKTVNNEFKGLRTLSPIIGITKWEGKQDKDTILKLMKENTPDLNLFIFDKDENIYK